MLICAHVNMYRAPCKRRINCMSYIVVQFFFSSFCFVCFFILLSFLSILLPLPRRMSFHFVSIAGAVVVLPRIQWFHFCSLQFFIFGCLHWLIMRNDIYTSLDNKFFILLGFVQRCEYIDVGQSAFASTHWHCCINGPFVCLIEHVLIHGGTVWRLWWFRKIGEKRKEAKNKLTEVHELSSKWIDQKSMLTFKCQMHIKWLFELLFQRKRLATVDHDHKCRWRLHIGYGSPKIYISLWHIIESQCLKCLEWNNN